ncbi:GroES-like protein [Suillus subalutaceus]|uniref:GroES-like protein n=1 Tax=Suillus subalutaceus TaxID=48586 RepID=UPI001B87E423|nr:GroES-like protein [Suillus subalutaceus]KAG1864116.1 GroES-like protein [Suillus subalutaceus]
MQAATDILQSQLGKLPTVVQPEYKHRGDGSTMKTLAWFGATDVRVIDAPIPDITEPDDVIVQATGTTICGSDLHLYHGEIMALQKGDILGHEFMRVVDRIGPNVKNLAIGQRVNYMYGTRDAGFFGYSHFTGGFPSGQAEYDRVPLGEVNLLPISNDVSDEEALCLSDEGDTVRIWGLGPTPIGQCCIRWAKLKGASRIITIDQVPERLECAKEQGCEVVNFSTVKDVSQKVHEMVPGGFDVAVQLTVVHSTNRRPYFYKGMKMLMLETDVPETANEMIVSVRKIGRCGLIAAYAGFTNGFNIGALMEKGVRFISNGQAPVRLHHGEQI